MPEVEAEARAAPGWEAVVRMEVVAVAGSAAAVVTVRVAAVLVKAEVGSATVRPLEEPPWLETLGVQELLLLLERQFARARLLQLAKARQQTAVSMLPLAALVVTAVIARLT